MSKLDSPLVVDRSPTLSDDQWRRLLQIRANNPGAVAEAYAQLLRRGSVVRDPAAWVWRAFMSEDW